MTGDERFETPAFKKRLKSMLKLDFYRLFTTPNFYIFLLIAAIIPAMIVGTSGMDGAGAAGNTAYPAPAAVVIDNAWQLIESTGVSANDPLDFGGYANINMLFIFAGLMMAVFVAHDYGSGFVKNIFTVHSKKIDYIISKSAVGVFGGAGMIIMYICGTVLAGLLTGKAFDVNISGLAMCLISKTFLMGVFCSLFMGIAVFFRNKLWMTIVFTFLFGMMLYPAAGVATLSSTAITMLLALAAGAVGAVAFGGVSNVILKKRDLV